MKAASQMVPLRAAAQAFERDLLLRALAEAGGRRIKAAEALGISRKNLWEKLRVYGIEDGDGGARGVGAGPGGEAREQAG